MITDDAARSRVPSVQFKKNPYTIQQSFPNSSSEKLVRQQLNDSQPHEKYSYLKYSENNFESGIIRKINTHVSYFYEYVGLLAVRYTIV